MASYPTWAYRKRWTEVATVFFSEYLATARDIHRDCVFMYRMGEDLGDLGVLSRKIGKLHRSGRFTQGQVTAVFRRELGEFDRLTKHGTADANELNVLAGRLNYIGSGFLRNAPRPSPQVLKECSTLCKERCTRIPSWLVRSVITGLYIA